MKIAKSSNTRVFVIEGRARPDHSPVYESCLRMTGVSQGFGDIERVECPDPYNYGKFVEVAEIRGATERATTSLEGRFAMNLLSTLLKLAKKGCSVDIQLHMGACQDPSDFDNFDKALVLESASLTTYNTDELGALQSDDNAAVNENADVSAKEYYEIVPLSFAERAGSIVTNEVVDVVVADSASCGDCEEESDGCNKVFAITLSAGGSPTTPADVVFSLDAGSVWYAHDIDSLGAAEDPDGVDRVGAYLVVVSNASASLHYALKSEFDGITDPTFTEVTTGFVASGEPNDIWSAGNTAFIVGDGGYVYMTSDPTAGVTVVDAGSATVDVLNAVHGLSAEFAVAVGNNGAVIYTENGTSWTAASVPVGVGVNLLCVFVKSENEWFVGASNGNLYYTLNKGTTWTAKTFPGSGSGVVYDIVFPTDSVGYLAHATSAPLGRILRTYNGGNTWVVMPEGVGTIPDNDRVNRLGYCDDANFIVGVGLGGNATDGYVVVGSAS